MYERFFGLSDAPFRLTPDPRYLFQSKKHAEALAHLKLGLSESGFVCITGDVGTGKTTLLRTFLAQLGDEVRAAYVFNPALSSLELLQTICAEFGVPARSTSPKELIDALNAHLLAERAAGRRCVVVVDEAQALGVEVLEQLRLLSNLETTTEKLLRIILVGQPQLRRLLLHPELVQLNQRITLRWHMGPLERTETASYVRHRLAVAGGFESRQLFTNPALAAVHRFSGGVPRLINMIAHRSLLAAFAAEQPRVTAALVRRARRELETIPLSARPAGFQRWVSATTGGLLLGLGIGAGAWWGLGALRGPAAPVAVPVVPADPPSEVEVPTPAPSLPAVATDPIPSTTIANAMVPERPPAVPLEERLAQLDRRTGERMALEAILSAWKTTPLKPGEAVDPRVAGGARDLEHVVVSANLSMLKLLDLPAILEVAGPRFDGPWQVALVGIDNGRPVLMINDERTIVEQGELELLWHGRAQLLWRDFEALGPTTLGPETTGRPIRSLQMLLARAGIESGPPANYYSPQLGEAVQAFQSRWFLSPDGRVGPLTSIALYAAAGGYVRPSLATRGSS